MDTFRLVALAPVFLCGSVHALESPDEARNHVTAAAKSFEGGHYEAALVEFQAARAVRPHPGLWWDIAICLEHLGRPDDAAAAYEAFAGSAVDPSDATSARERLQAIRARVPSPVAPKAVVQPPVAPTPTDTSRSAARFVAPIAVGVVSVAALAALTGLHFSIVERADYLRRDAGCAPACDPAEVADLERRAIAVYSLGAIAAAAAVVDTLLWIRAVRRGPVARTWIAPVPGGAVVGGRF